MHAWIHTLMDAQPEKMPLLHLLVMGGGIKNDERQSCNAVKSPLSVKSVLTQQICQDTTVTANEDLELAEDDDSGGTYSDDG